MPYSVQPSIRAASISSVGSPRYTAGRRKPRGRDQKRQRHAPAGIDELVGVNCLYNGKMRISVGIIITSSTSTNSRLRPLKEYLLRRTPPWRKRMPPLPDQQDRCCSGTICGTCPPVRSPAGRSSPGYSFEIKLELQVVAHHLLPRLEGREQQKKKASAQEPPGLPSAACSIGRKPLLYCHRPHQEALLKEPVRAS